jgi:hypothetical protein
MKNVYELVETLTSEVLKKTDENGVVSWIPKDTENSDYQEYLKSLESSKTETE